MINFNLRWRRTAADPERQRDGETIQFLLASLQELLPLVRPEEGGFLILGAGAAANEILGVTIIPEPNETIEHEAPDWQHYKPSE